MAAIVCMRAVIVNAIFASIMEKNRGCNDGAGRLKGKLIRKSEARRCTVLRLAQVHVEQVYLLMENRSRGLMTMFSLTIYL
jgi:hypothetical protein